jgi:hypothetical protein
MYQFLKKNWVILSIIFLGFIAGVYNLDGLPAEMWNDPINHYRLARAILSGNFFFDYQFGGDGPIYTYLVVLISSIVGLSYYTLKLTSVLISLCFIFTMYVLALEFFRKKEIAYITAFLTAVSFWSLNFARQPHARILVPLFVALTLFFALKKKTLLAGILLGVGMYAQASFWAMPFIFLNRLRIFLIGFLLTIPLFISFALYPTGFFSNNSYFGEKLALSSSLDFHQIIDIILSNLSSNLLAYNIQGDSSFRMNVPGDPHLDIISGGFFIIGFILITYKAIKEKKRQFLLYFVLLFFLIQLPSLLDIHNPLSQPNIGRMIGVIPIVFMSTAYGIYVVIKKISTYTVPTYLNIALILLIIATLNFNKYFNLYPQSLPNKNTSFDKIIAALIDTYPKNTTVVVIGSGWGEKKQPEKEAIQFQVTTLRPISFLSMNEAKTALCAKLKLQKNSVIFTDPAEKNIKKEAQKCGTVVHTKVIIANGYKVTRIIETYWKSSSN